MYGLTYKVTTSTPPPCPLRQHRACLTYKVTTSTCHSEGKPKLYSAPQTMQDCSEMCMPAFVDKTAGKLNRVDHTTIASITLEPQLEINYKVRRIILPKSDVTALQRILVLRPGIHYNRHLNNANYVRMAMELKY